MNLLNIMKELEKYQNFSFFTKTLRNLLIIPITKIKNPIIADILIQCLLFFTTPSFDRC